MMTSEGLYTLGSGVLALLQRLVLLFCIAAPAHAAVLEEVRSRGAINCGVGSDLDGFSTANSLGEYTGFDVDFCRAVAAAVLDDPDAVDFVPLDDADQFEALRSGRIDVLSRKTPLSLESHAQGAQFAGINYYDGQGFIVSRKQALRSALELDEVPLCVIRDARSEANIIDFFTINRLRYVPLFFDVEAEAFAALEAGECAALTANKSTLASQRSRFEQPGAFQVLPEVIAKKPLGPVVASGDAPWANVVRWTLSCMVNAEELGVDRDSVAQGSQNLTLAARRLLGLGDENDGDLLGLSSSWCAQVIRHVGNYGESFDRHLGPSTPLQLERGVNRLWTDGGLMYALPIH